MSVHEGTQTGAEIDDAVAATKGATAGIIVKTGTGTGVRRSIAVDTTYLAVTNGNGVAGNPTIDWHANQKTAIGKVGKSYVTLGTEITDSRALLTADTGKFFVVNKATNVTLTINTGQFAAGDVIEFFQKGEGLITFAVQTGAHQTINDEVFSQGLGTTVRLVCLDGTGEAEVFVVTNGQTDPD